MVVSTVLERNPEVIISGSLDLDEVRINSVFSPAYIRHVGEMSLQYRFFFDVNDVGMGRLHVL